jgi:hypothetical protein
MVEWNNNILRWFQITFIRKSASARTKRSHLCIYRIGVRVCTHEFVSSKSTILCTRANVCTTSALAPPTIITTAPLYSTLTHARTWLLAARPRSDVRYLCTICAGDNCAKSVSGKIRCVHGQFKCDSFRQWLTQMSPASRTDAGALWRRWRFIQMITVKRVSSTSRWSHRVVTCNRCLNIPVRACTSYLSLYFRRSQTHSKW